MPEPSSLSHSVPFPAFSTSWLSENTLVVTGGGGASKTGVPNGMIVYEVRRGVQELKEIRRHDTGDSLPYWSTAMPDIGLLAVAIEDHLDLYRLSDLKKLTSVVRVATEEHQDPILVAAFSDDASLLAVGAHDGHVRIYNLSIRNPGPKVEANVDSSGLQVRMTKTPAKRPYRSLAFYGDNKHIIGACDDGKWRIWALQATDLHFESEKSPGDTTPSTVLSNNHTCTKTSKAEAAKAASSVLYCCRCAQFTKDKKWLFTVHYTRAGPRGTDKRPYLVKWSLDETKDGKLVWEFEKKCVINSSPIMCLSLAGDGLIGVMGDSEGCTICFETDSLLYRMQEKMSYMGVTGIGAVPWSRPDEGKGKEHKGSEFGSKYLVVSSSGDRRLRVQLRPRPKDETCVAVVILIWLGFLQFLQNRTFLERARVVARHGGVMRMVEGKSGRTCAMGLVVLGPFLACLAWLVWQYKGSDPEST